MTACGAECVKVCVSVYVRVSVCVRVSVSEYRGG